MVLVAVGVTTVRGGTGGGGGRECKPITTACPKREGSWGIGCRELEGEGGF